MNLRFFRLLLIIVLAFPLWLFAQENDNIRLNNPAFWTHFTVNNGLPSDEIRQVIDDDAGLIIVTVNDGLYRYNGQEFTPLSLNKNLPSLFIQATQKDHLGRLWIACNYSGLYIYDKGHLIPYTFNHRFQGQHFTLLKVDDDGSIWVGVNKVGLFRIVDDHCESMFELFSLPKDDVIDIRQSGMDYFLLLSNYGLYRFSLDAPGVSWPVFSDASRINAFVLDDRSQLTVIRDNSELSIYNSRLEIVHSEPVQLDAECHLMSDYREQLWFASRGVFCKDNQETQHYDLDAYVTGLHQDQFNVLWVATRNNGLYRYINPDLHKMQLPSVMHQDKEVVYQATPVIYQDSQNEYWFNDAVGRLYHTVGSRIQYLKLADSLRVSAFIEDRQGNYWIGTDEYGIFRITGDGVEKPEWISGDCGGRVSCINRDSAGRIWAGYLSLLPQNATSSKMKLNLPAFRSSQRSHRNNPGFTSFYVDPKGTPWFGSAESLLYMVQGSRLLPTSGPRTRYPFLAGMRNLRMHEDVLWGSTYTGLFSYDPTSLEYTQYMLPSRYPAEMDVFFYANVNWVANDYFYMNNALRLTSIGGQHDWNEEPFVYNVSALAVDTAGCTWIGSYSTGLYRLDQMGLTRFDHSHGFEAHSVSDLLWDSKNRLWVATLDEGLYLLDEYGMHHQSLPQSSLKLTSIYESLNGDIWLGTLDHGIVRISERKATMMPGRGSGFSVWGFAENGDGSVYTCCENGDFGIIQNNVYKILTQNQALTDSALCAAFSGQCINMNTHYARLQSSLSPGLLAFSPEQKFCKGYTIVDGLPGHEITDIDIQKNQILVSTFNTGLAELSDSSFKHISGTGRPGISRFVDVNYDDKMRIYGLTADEGLMNIDGQSSTVWGAETKIITSMAHTLMLNQQNRLTLLSSFAAHYFDEANLYSMKLPFVGVNTDVQVRAGMLNSANEIVYVTDHRQFVRLKLNDQPPSLQFTSCFINGREMEALTTETVVKSSYKEKSCILEYVGYHARFPSHSIVTSWRIVQGDDSTEWSPFEAGGRLSLHRLVPGKGNLIQIRARTPDGLVSLKPLSVNIFLESVPLLLRPISLIIMAIVILFLTAGTLWGRQNRLRALILNRKFNPYIAGTPLLGPEMFYGRAHEITNICRHLRHNSLMLIGERRIGKTTMLHQLSKVLKEDSGDIDFLPVYIDLQGVQEWAFFYLIMGELVQCFGQRIEDADLLWHREKDGYDYRNFNADLRTVIRTMNSIEGDRCKLVLLIDEADVMNDFDQIVHARFRRIFMQEYAQNLAVVMAGTAIDREWNRPESPWWNLFTVLNLGPIEKKEAEKLIKKPVAGFYSFTSSAVYRILEISGCIPYRIQLICVYLIDRAIQNHSTMIRVGDVDIVMKEQIVNIIQPASGEHA